MKKYNKYGANQKNPSQMPWGNGVLVKPQIREYLKRLFQEDANKGLKPIYYWHHHAQQVMAMDERSELEYQERVFNKNNVKLVETRILTNQSWSGYEKVYMSIYRNMTGEQISNRGDALSFSFDYMNGLSELLYFSFHPFHDGHYETIEVCDDITFINIP